MTFPLLHTFILKQSGVVSTNQPTNQPTNQSTDRPTDNHHHHHRPTNQPTNQPASQQARRPKTYYPAIQCNGDLIYLALLLGYYCADAVSAPVACPDGEISGPNQTDCTRCANDQVVSSGRQYCDPCPAGYECTDVV